MCGKDEHTKVMEMDAERTGIGRMEHWEVGWIIEHFESRNIVWC